MRERLGGFQPSLARPFISAIEQGLSNMKTKLALVITGSTLSGLMLASCGGGSDTVPTPPTPPASSLSSTTDLNTSDVLSIVQTRTSETSSPITVDGGAILVVPTDDETGTPITINGST